MIRVGFALLGQGRWTGGIVYLQNTLRIIRSHLSDEIEAVLLLSPEEQAQHGQQLSPLASETRVDPAFQNWGRGTGLYTALIQGRDGAATELYAKAGVTTLFENAAYYGWRPGASVLAWFPDFQHRLMPQMFSRAEWWRREIGFRVQIASGRTIMVSSESARLDCEAFYPQTRGRVQVVRFASNIDPTAPVVPKEALRQKYNLPERYIFLPNQFWRHKNHQVIADALLLLRDQSSQPIAIVASGRQDDPRHPEHYAQFMAFIVQHGLTQQFRHLGVIPFGDVMGLVASCDYLINPSHFEGWSTPIEEAKAFGTPLLLSDIKVHREQAPRAKFFDPESAEACAEALMFATRTPSTRAPAAMLISDQSTRLARHAKELKSAILASLNNNSQNR